MTIKHPITGERTGYFDENATALKVGDTVELFGQNGTVTFDEKRPKRKNGKKS